MKNKRIHRLIWASSYDRGIIHLLKMWPKILAKFPDTTLEIFYGWDLFLKGFQNNPERMKWKAKIDEMMTQTGITHHGRVGKLKLLEHMGNSGIIPYCTDFEEINCITVLNAQKVGCVPCVINKAALKETVGSGIKIDGEIWDPEVREEYLTKLLELMGDEEKWQEESKKGIEFAKSYSWDKIANLWIKEF